MQKFIIGAGVTAILALAGCGNPASNEAREQGDANRAALDGCYQAAGFTTGQTSPAPADGGNRRGPGGDAWNEGSIQAPGGTWLDVYSWSEWTDDPDHAETAATYQADQFNQQGYAGYGPARAVGRRAYVVVGSTQPFENAALDACLMMP